MPTINKVGLVKPTYLLAITAGLLLINGINRHNIKQSMLEAEKMLEMKSEIPDTLKIIKK